MLKKTSLSLFASFIIVSIIPGAELALRRFYPSLQIVKVTEQENGDRILPLSGKATLNSIVYSGFIEPKNMMSKAAMSVIGAVNRLQPKNGRIIVKDRERTVGILRREATIFNFC